MLLFDGNSDNVLRSFFSRVSWLLGWMYSDENRDNASPLELAKWALVADEEVQFGIFWHIGYSGFFRPREFLNKFLMRELDSCDQDGRMPPWPLRPSNEKALRWLTSIVESRWETAMILSPRTTVALQLMRVR
jgi:hypothetical protein